MDYLSEPSQTLNEYHALINNWFLQMQSPIMVLPLPSLVAWLQPGEDNFFEGSVDLSTIELFDRMSNSWKYQLIVGMCTISMPMSQDLQHEVHCVAVVDLDTRVLELSFNCSAPVELNKEEMALNVQYGLQLWLQRSCETFTFSFVYPVASACMDPILLSLGTLLHRVNLFTDISFESDRDSVVEAIMDLMPSAPKIQVFRSIELQDAEYPSLLEFGFSTEFTIPDEVHTMVRSYIESLGTRSVTISVALMITLFFCKESLVVSEAVSLASQLGLIDRVPTSRHSAESKHWWANMNGQINNAINTSASTKDFGMTRTGATGGRVTQSLQKNTRESRFQQATVLRKVKGRGKAGKHWYIYTVSNAGRTEVMKLFGMCSDSVVEEEANLSNPAMLLKKLLQTHTELSAQDLQDLWQAQKANGEFERCKKRPGVLSNLLNFGLGNGKWKSKPWIQRVYRDGQPFYRLADDTHLLPPVIIDDSLSYLAEQILEFFQTRSLLLAEDICARLGLMMNQSTLSETADACEELARRQIICLNPRKPAEQRAYMRCEGTLTFEKFYSALNSSLLPLEQQNLGLAFSRPDAHRVYHSGDFTRSKSWWSKFMPASNATSALKVQYIDEQFGSGLFAAVPLSKGFHIPVHGKESSRKPKEFRSHCFKLQVAENQYSYIDTKPADEVLCLAGYANDPRGTGLEANAEQRFCVREPGKLYLVLTRDLKEGEQILWPYGEKYWQSKPTEFGMIFQNLQTSFDRQEDCDLFNTPPGLAFEDSQANLVEVENQADQCGENSWRPVDMEPLPFEIEWSA